MKHILMVDDVATNLKCAGEILGDKYEITTAKSGEKAFLSMKEKTPDLILLDINMPGMNGFEVLEKLKSDSEFSEIPVIFCTAETNKEAEIKGLEMGAVDFIRKPYVPEVLCSRVERVLEDYGLRNAKPAEAYEGDDRQENFQKAYRMLSSLEKEEKTGQLVLLWVPQVQKGEEGEKMAALLDKVVSASFRKDDTIIKSGWLQYLVLLRNVSFENGEMAAKRVKERFEDGTEGKLPRLEYEIKSI